MRKHYALVLLLFLALSCKHEKKKEDTFTIAFGSCNNQHIENTLWKEIQKSNPAVFISSGDIIYSDTEDMALMEKNFLAQKNEASYADFVQDIEVLATWDDHDFGVNDGGYDYPKKDEVQQLFLDFLDVPEDDKRRLRKGVYHSKNYTINGKTVKIILLDTRYFKSAPKLDTISKKRYAPNYDEKATILGETQWKWLSNELNTSSAHFNIIVSSIQFLSHEHGFECWGNMPNEVQRMEDLIEASKAKNVMMISGDRHISEVSRKELPDLNYPLIDVTSSGLTHAYNGFTGELNRYRIVDVVAEKSFGVLKLNMETNEATVELRGENNVLLRVYKQKYPL